LKWNGTAWASSPDAGITSEQDGIIGNEVTNATSNGGLTRSGSGTAVSPYTLGITSGGVTNTHLADNAVTIAKISDNAVTSAKIADGAITNADINASAAIALSKIALPDASSNNGKVLKSNGTTWTAGDDNNTDANTTYAAGNGLTLAGTTFSIGTGQVTGTMIADGSVATAKIANSAVTSEKIANGTIKAEDLNGMGASEGNVLTYTGSSWLPKPVNLDGAVVYLGTNDETYSPVPSGTYSAGQILSIFIKVDVPAGYSYYILVPYSSANVMFPAFASTIGSGVHSRHIIFTKSTSYSSFNVKYLVFGIK
jgi:hypothetical protein